jgi:hypothetical protein
MRINWFPRSPCPEPGRRSGGEALERRIMSALQKKHIRKKNISTNKSRVGIEGKNQKVPKIGIAGS